MYLHYSQGISKKTGYSTPAALGGGANPPQACKTGSPTFAAGNRLSWGPVRWAAPF